MPKTQYESLMDKRDLCVKRAACQKDANMRMFFMNAAKGFEIKAGRLSIKESGLPEK